MYQAALSTTLQHLQPEDATQGHDLDRRSIFKLSTECVNAGLVQLADIVDSEI